MPEPKILRSYDNWENGIGHLRDDGSPSLYTSDKILGLKGELRPAPAATQVTIDADPGHHFQYFFEEPVTAGQTPALDGKSTSKTSATSTSLSLAHTLHTIGDNDNQILLIYVFQTDPAWAHQPSSLVIAGGSGGLVGYKGVAGIGALYLYAVTTPVIGAGTFFQLDWTAIDNATDVVVSASTWYKVDLNGPFGDGTSTTAGADVGPASATVISKTGDIVIAGGMATDDDETMTVVNETEINQDQQGDIRGATSYEAGAGAVDMDWTLGNPCDWIVLGFSLQGVHPGPSYLYAQRGKKSTTSSTVKVNKTSLSTADFGATSTTSYHNLTPLTIPGQPVRYQGYWWFPMGDDQKARKLTTVGVIAVDSTAVINEGATFSATDTALTVDDGTQFTDDDYIKIDGEILKVTNIATHVLTVTRGQYGTTAATHADGSVVYLITTSSDTLAATATALGADHFANLNHQVISTLKHSGNDAGGIRVLKEDGDIGTEAHWGSVFQVGDKNERAAGISSLMGLSFVLNVEGLYSFNATGRSGIVFEDFRMWRHIFDNISIKPWKQGLLISHPTGLLYYTPGQLPINVGIDVSAAEAAIAPPGPPKIRGGRYHSTAPIGDFVPAIYQPDLNSTTVNVLIGYPSSNNPDSLVWQHLATTELQDTDHMLGCFVTVSSKPISAEYVTPVLWYGNDDDLDYIVLNSRASPFRTREDTHVVATSGDAYFPEMFFPVPHKISHVVIYTQDMVSGDEWQVSAIINAGKDFPAGGPVKTSQRAPRKLNRDGVYRMMLHVNWKANSTSARVPPTIKKIDVYGTPENAG